MTKMNQNPAKEPLNIYGLLGAATGAALGVAVWYLFLFNPGADDEMRFAGCFVGGIVIGALCGNTFGKALRKR